MELQLSDVNFKLLLEESLKISKEMAINRKIEFKAEIGHLPEIIRADERKLKKILYNLLSNAVKFTPEGGEICLTAELLNSEDIGKPEETGISQFIRISISDTGIGLEDNSFDYIFAPFKQVDSSISRKFEGAGIGLALTRKFVSLHGGQIGVTSDGLKKGSTFIFTIPIRV